ncbi:FdtA/QdtA family cupin domain-containing protein [Maribacter sp. PR1]|uniref:FdtA/QdtA family cupin domain-containing protein n=1 Tax=Maribacter cobaltidurans TaxID=1178778 RepID=A0ABU7IW22_9FLAO|nr:MULTISPECIES: FdtA/QdtA family cupin domain-containing protein [Maribacter]MDC6389761.1 FdtA/QdtA family cupin domain-containing protein [Maribacter sp. PR1]MEE1977151.1 FdtA/QdtA family cupin domain-containing protein [Maribacter cobaltidurans]
MMIHKPKIIELPKILDDRGNLSLFENDGHIPFSIKRTYWIYDVPGGAIRGSHAFKKSNEFIIALSGSFDVILNDGQSEITHNLNRSYYGLFVPKGIWRYMENFATNSVALLVSDTVFDEDDYIRDKDEFLRLKSK